MISYLHNNGTNQLYYKVSVNRLDQCPGFRPLLVVCRTGGSSTLCEAISINVTMFEKHTNGQMAFNTRPVTPPASPSPSPLNARHAG